MHHRYGKLFLIPTPVSEGAVESLSGETISVIHGLRYFIVERLRTARRIVSAVKHPVAIDELVFEEIPETKLEHNDMHRMLGPLREGIDMGLMSEAGAPAVADPGSGIVAFAHSMKIKVIPLAGPSSIMMALMASGLEGQRFAFHGYLSAKKNELPAQLRFLDKRASVDDATQIFIEAPYRNRQILDAVSMNIAPDKKFCIAANLGSHEGFVLTRSVGEWRKEGWPDIHKVPTVFLVGV